MKKIIKLLISRFKHYFCFSSRKKRVKYKLDRYDKKFIKFMEDKYNMKPSFNDDGLYFYDLKTYPAFGDAILKSSNN